MAELMLVLFAILAILTPFVALFLPVKYNKLRAELDQLEADNSNQHEAQSFRGTRKARTRNSPNLPSRV
jgi:hypothetical protein